MSDLHATDLDVEPAPSFLRTSMEQSETRHPTFGLASLIKSTGLTADILMCPGDLGDKARPAGIQYAWKELHSLAADLSSPYVIATAGNHDVDSRHSYNQFDAKGHLQSLSPPFPLPSSEHNDKFWSRHFVLLDSFDWYRILVLNSSAFHGQEKESERGRISPYTLDAIRISLIDSVKRPLNILLCHHHPLQHSEINLGEFDVMADGQLLLDLLGTGDYGEWLIIHGHKHHPKLCYAAGGASSPIIFSAGSLSACLYPQLYTVTRNQFYTLEFREAEIMRSGLQGTYRSWQWIYNSGWSVATKGTGLPAYGGFGFRGRIPSLASQIDALMGDNKYLDWSTVEGVIADVKYLIPIDFSSLVTQLEEHSIGIDYDSYFVPRQILRK